MAWLLGYFPAREVEAALNALADDADEDVRETAADSLLRARRRRG